MLVFPILAEDRETPLSMLRLPQRPLATADPRDKEHRLA